VYRFITSFVEEINGSCCKHLGVIRQNDSTTYRMYCNQYIRNIFYNSTVDQRCKFKNVTLLLREGCKSSMGDQNMLKVTTVKSTYVNICLSSYLWNQVDDLCHIFRKFQGNEASINFNRTYYIVVIVSEYRLRN
jgi:hypothetical protein